MASWLIQITKFKFDCLGKRYLSTWHKDAIVTPKYDALKVIDFDSIKRDDDDYIARRQPLDLFVDLYNKHSDEDIGMIRTKHDGFIHILRDKPFKDLWKAEAKGNVTTFWPDTTRELLGHDSFAAISGYRHLMYRKILNPFFRDNVLKQRFNVVYNQTDKLLNCLVNDTNKFLNDEEKKYLDVFYYGRTWSWNITINFVFGYDAQTILNWSDEFENIFFHNFIDFTKGLVDLNMDNLNDKDTPLGYAMYKREFVLDDLKLLINLSMKNLDKLDEKCIIYKLLKDNVMNEYEISLDELAIQILLILWAGHETTAISFANLIYCLDQFSVDIKVTNEYKQFYDDIKQHIVDTNNKLDYDFIVEHKYLNWFIQEVMRYTPVVPYFCKVFTDDIEMNECPFSKGDIAVMNGATAKNKNIFRDQNNSYKDLHKFDPLRWQSPPEKTSWIPFGFGNKMCLGWRLAMIELKLMTIFCITKLDFQLDLQRSLKKADSGFNYYNVHAQFFKKK